MAILMCYYVQQVLIVRNKPASVSFPKNNINKLGGIEEHKLQTALQGFSGV